MADAEVVVVCTPVSRIADDVRRVAEAAPGHVLVTDAGSSKRQIVEAVERHPRSAAVFVGAHPLAGSERRGVASCPRRLVRRPRLRADAHRPNSARPQPAARMPSGRRSAAASSKCHPPSTTRSSHTPAICRTQWRPRWPRRFPPTGCRWPPAPTATARASPPPTPDSGRRFFATTAGLLLKALGTVQECLDAFKYALMTDDEEAIRRGGIRPRNDATSSTPSSPHRNRRRIRRPATT